MNPLVPQSTAPQSRRRWLQFSLRMLLVAVVVCSVPCGWVAYKVNQARGRLAAVEAILRRAVRSTNL